MHVPAVEDAADDLRTDPAAYFRSLSAEDQDRYFTKGGAEAIRLGADIGRVVNVRRPSRGMSQPGRQRGGRVMPEELLEHAAGDRDEAVRLLRRNGFIF